MTLKPTPPESALPRGARDSVEYHSTQIIMENLNLASPAHRIAHPLRSRRALVLALSLLLGATALWAHHGLAAFDTTHTVRMEGTVTKVEWINPHAFIYADLTDDKGHKANWRCELGSLGMLTKYGGWTPTTVKPGDPIRIQGFVAKDGSPYISVGTVWIRGGKSLQGKP
jgi:hypothetical protein